MSDELTPRQREIVERMRETGISMQIWDLPNRGPFAYIGLLRVDLRSARGLIRRGILKFRAGNDETRFYALSPEYQHGESDG